MKKPIELLAPAGSVDALHAAVENGADAVYLGGKLFNARQQADNFDRTVLSEALEYAHTKGASIYLTMNTLISDAEMEQALSFAAEVREDGIDGIIVQDLGLAAALHRIMPEVPLHASTQMTIYDLEGVRVLEGMGFKRVVPARELTLAEVSEIVRNTGLEVEIFVHGALCVCYSGQCLMSSMIGGRSGNRGRCAQPCRLPYGLAGGSSAQHGGLKGPASAGGSGRYRGGASDAEAKYLLSPRDICTLDQLPAIAASGVASLKIEGRMKSPEYVATVVRIYRKYLDRALNNVSRGDFSALSVADEDMHDLMQIFNRGGFTPGYLKGKTGSDMMSYEKPNNRGVFLGTVKAYDHRTQSISLRLEDRLAAGDGIEIWAGGSDSTGGVVTAFRSGGVESKTAGRGELVTVGSFRGRILPGQRVYKTSDAALNRAARESFTGKNLKRMGIRGYAVLKTGKPLLLKVEDEDGRSAAAEGAQIPEAAVNRPLTAERLSEQLRKTGSTPFEFTDLQIDLEEGLSIPVGEINDVRRRVLEELQRQRADRYSGQRPTEGLQEHIRKELQSFYACEDKNATDKASNASVGTNDSALLSAGTRRREPAISLYFYKWDPKADYSSFGAERLYFPFAALEKQGFPEAARAARDAGAEVFVWLPAITKGNIGKLIKRLAGDQTAEIDGILAGNLGTVRSLMELGLNAGRNEAEASGNKETVGSSAAGGNSALGSSSAVGGNSALGSSSAAVDIKVAGDITLNIFNAMSLYKAVTLCPAGAALSAELTLTQIFDLLRSFQSCRQAGNFTSISGSLPLIEAAVYGRLPLMTSEYCPVGCTKGGFSASAKCSGICGSGDYKLVDRMNMEFPVLCDRVDCRSTILNSNVLFVPDSLRSLRKAGVGLFRMYIWDESPRTVKELVQLYKAATNGDENKMASYAELAQNIKSAGFTKGHYYRGV